jgi:hypothetical protein
MRHGGRAVNTVYNYFRVSLIIQRQMRDGGTIPVKAARNDLLAHAIAHQDKVGTNAVMDKRERHAVRDQKGCT